MADEIENANVIRIWHDDAVGLWRARIGPDGDAGIAFEASRPIEVICGLATVLQWYGWPFDPSWRPAFEAKAVEDV